LKFVYRCSVLSNGLNHYLSMTGLPETDQLFISKLTEIVLTNLSDENFGVKQLIDKSGMTYTSLSRKLRNIADKSINQFIREVRLKKAFELLKEGKVTAAEAAFKVGFGSPAYFSTCFHELYGFPPGQVRKENFEKNNGNIPPQNTIKYRQKGFIWKRIITASSGILVISVLAYLGYMNFFRNSSAESGNSAESREKSIAVLPFANFSPDSENVYFSNGITDEILNQLVRIRDLRVKARTSVEKYRNSRLDARAIGKELNVSLIMEGSVRKSGDDLRITAQLIDAKTGDHLWSETYDGKYSIAIFEFQSSVAKKVAESLNAVITPREMEKIELVPTHNMQAHELYMKSMDMLTTAIEGGGFAYYRLALNLANQALEYDPDYTGALLVKSRCYYFLGNRDSSFYYAKKTLGLDPENPKALNEMAHYYFYTNASDSALKYWKKTLEYPSLEERYWSYLGIGQVLFFQKNRVIESLPYYQKALEAGGDTIAGINMNIGMLFYAIGDYEKAYSYARKALYISPTCNYAREAFTFLLGGKNYEKTLHFIDSVKNVIPCEQLCNVMRVHLFTVLRLYDSASVYLNRIDIRYFDNADLYYNYFLIETGKRNEAYPNIKFLATLQERLSSTGKIPWFSQNYEIVAACYALLGEREKCLKTLSELEKIGCSNAPYGYNIFPGFDYLRSDPEFTAIINRLEANKTAIRKQISRMIKKGDINL